MINDKIMLLSSKNYADNLKNHGDCVLIDVSGSLYTYDCGSEEHADQVIKYMEDKDYDKVIFILSHNDSDHFNGLEKLIDEKKVEKVYCTLLLKYKDEILETIGDGRKNKNSIGDQIVKLYDNINSLSGKVKLINIYDDAGNLQSIGGDISIIGPSKKDLIDSVAKELDSREGDTIDGETIVNATSVQLSVNLDGDSLYLTGDASFNAIKPNLEKFNIIQLPHHGKKAIADKIFDELEEDISIKYVVSDNTGNSNGGSDDLETKGYNVENTMDGDIILQAGQEKPNNPIGNYGYKKIIIGR